jgi:hypothetical protein
MALTDFCGSSWDGTDTDSQKHRTAAVSRSVATQKW